MNERVEELESALREVAHVLGGAADPHPREWKCGNNCEGCRHEMATASLAALQALGFATYDEMLAASGAGTPGETQP